MTNATKQNSKKISDGEIRQLVIERLKTFPSGKKISIGSDGDFSKEELIAHVGQEDKIGKKIIEIQLAYLRSFKEGSLFEE